MIKRLSFSPFLKDLVLTTATSIITMLSVIITRRILAQGLGAKEFGAYSLAIRLVLTMMPFTTLMMGTTLARYIGLSRYNSSKDNYFLGGFLIGVSISPIFLVIGLVNRNYFTGLIYHSQVYVPLFVATLIMLVGYSFYNILSGFYRGHSKMGLFNLWNFVVRGFGPLIIAYSCVKFGKADLIILLTSGLFYVSFIPLSFYVGKALSQKKKCKKLKMIRQLKELLQYGIPRTPSGILFTGLLTIGPFLAPYFGPMKEAGYLVIGQSVFSLENAIVAFGLVALPKVASLSAEGKNEFLKERITDAIAFVFYFGMFVTLHLLLWADQIVLLWLGEQYQEAISLMRILLLSLIPYFTYVMLRGIINAIEKKAINTFNVFLSFLMNLTISLLLAKIGWGTIGLAIGTDIGFLVLGVTTVYYLWRIYQFKFNDFMMKKCLLLNTIFIIGAFILKYVSEIKSRGLVLITIAVIGEGLLLLLYYLALRKWNVRWVVELEKRIVR